MKDQKFSTNKTSKWIVLLVVIAMTFMATLDSSIVNSTLPVMSKELKVPLSSIEWVVASYVIIICSTILFFGRLGDIVGKTKVFQCGSIVFTLGSLLCGFSHSFVLLILARFIQGIGASAYMANNQGIITEIFSKQRGKALGILVTAVALGNMIGPPAGGIIVSALSWNYIFLINVPIGIIVFIMGIKYLPKTKNVSGKLDMPGFVLQFLGTSLFFASLILAQKIGFSNKYIICTLILSLILITLFIYTEAKNNQPLLTLKIFKNKLFSVSLICAFISFVCLAASAILLPFYFQYTMKLSPFSAGLILMVCPITLAIFSPICGTLSDKIGSEMLSLIGLCIMSAAFLFLSFLTQHSIILKAAIFMAIMSLGQSIFQPSNNSLIMGNCKRNELGIAGSVNSLVRNLGQIVGITLSTTLLYSFMSQKLHYHVLGYVFGKDYAFVYGMKNVYLILSIICCIGIAFTLCRILKKK
ncbi:MAG: MFS transporter [Clostridium sp.]|nr:MFS transporter [Clostridium sp.]